MARLATRCCHAGGDRSNGARSLRRHHIQQGRRHDHVLQEGRQVLGSDRRPGRGTRDFEIRYTFGISPLQQYLIELSGGRLQALGIAWDARSKEEGGQRWYDLYPDRKLKAGDPLHWTGIDQNWNYQCAWCHSTNLKKNYDHVTRRYDTDVVRDQRGMRSLSRARVEPCGMGVEIKRLGEIRPAREGIFAEL